MAGAVRSWIWPLLVAALLGAGAGRPFAAQSVQSGTGSIAGKLTDLHSMPVEGAAVVVRNETTGVEARTITQKKGSYRFAGLEPGEYTVEAASGQQGRGRLEGVRVVAGQEARVQTAMSFEISSPEPVRAVSQDIRPVTAALDTQVAAEPLGQVALKERSLPKLPSEMPATVIPVLTATLAATPLQVLPLPGQQATESSPSAPVIAPAVSVASAGARQTTAELTRTETKPVQTVSRSVDPVAQVVTTTMSGAEVQALPASGRRWQDFVLDTPSVATAAGGQAQASVRGAGQEPAETTVDGASIRLAFGGQGGSGPGSAGPGANGQGGAEQNGMGRAWSGGRGPGVAEAAIRQVETTAGNVESAAGRTAGGRMSVETERGGDGLHGQGFLFDRQNIWGARNPFTEWMKETAPATLTTTPAFLPEPYTPPDHELVWGVGVGSQIRRNKIFWFGALDSLRRNDPGLATVKHPDEFFAQPSNDQMQALSARLGLNGDNPVAEGLAAYSGMLETLGGLLGPAPRTAQQWVGFGRVDWKAAERHSFTLEGIGARWNSPGGGLTRVSETYGANSFGSSRASEEWLMGRWEAFLTPNLLAVTQGSVGRTIETAHAETPSSFEQTFLGPNVYGQLPQMVVDSRYGFTIGNPSRFGQGSYPDERVYQAQERLDWVRGNLLVRSGFDFSHNSDATSLLRNQTGTYTYSSVENFASDALTFAAFGMNGDATPYAPNQRGCDETGKVWRDSLGVLRGLDALPCYSYYSQVMGPTNWSLSTNDWAGYTTAQWQAGKLAVFSAGLRWELEQMPPPLAMLANSELPLTEKMPGLGNNWGPRLSLAIGDAKTHWPVLRVGYGMYFGRTENATLETVLTQSGSSKGDMNFFLRPTDDLPNNGGGAPPFPYVLAGEPLSMVKPGAVEFAPHFQNPEVHQAVVGVEETLPGHVELTGSAMVSLGRRLPVSIDTNHNPPTATETITYNVCDQTAGGAGITSCGHTGLGPIKATQITVPFYASWPASDGLSGRMNSNYQQISEVMSRANSTYEAAMLKVVRYGRRGLSVHAHYTYAHAMDWNPNESTLVTGSDVLDPANYGREYGTSNLDVRHSAAVMAVFETPWKLRGWARQAGNGWMVSGIGQFRSGLPYTMRTSGSLAEEFDSAGNAIVGLGPGMNGSGGDNRVFGVGNDGVTYDIGRNTYRYPSTWKADLRLGKSFNLGEMRKLELLAESFNLFNHQNVTALETTGYYIGSGDSSGGLPTLNFLTGLKANTTAFGQPLNINATDFYRERQIQLGVRMRF